MLFSLTCVPAVPESGCGGGVQVDGSVAAKQGIRFVFQDGSRIIFRISVRATPLAHPLPYTVSSHITHGPQPLF